MSCWPFGSRSSKNITGFNWLGAEKNWADQAEFERLFPYRKAPGGVIIFHPETFNRDSRLRVGKTAAAGGGTGRPFSTMGRRRSGAFSLGSIACGERGNKSRLRTRSITSGARASSSPTVVRLHAARTEAVSAKPINTGTLRSDLYRRGV